MSDDLAISMLIPVEKVIGDYLEEEKRKTVFVFLS